MSAKTNNAARRLAPLDAVRGIASFIVLLDHCYLTYPDHITSGIWMRPIRLLTNGDASVVIFFVLSGYVLSLPFNQGTQPIYPAYAFKRVCRIYIPFAAAICLAGLLCRIVDVQVCLAAASYWFNAPGWSWPGLSGFLRHFLMTGMDTRLDGPIWSLVHEMRLSLIFPLLILLCRDTRLALAAAAILLVQSANKLSGLEQIGPWQPDDLRTSLLWTVHFAPFFVLGILLSKHAEAIRQVLRRVPAPLQFALAAVPIIIFMLQFDYLLISRDILYCIGAASVIVLALEVRWIRAMLRGAELQWLGRISYSLYLIHVPLINMLFYVLLGHAPFWLIGFFVIAASLSLATLMHRYIEMPSIEFGQRVARAGFTTGVAVARSG